MAYIKDIERPCSDCFKRATKELFNIRNASYGYFCGMHANRRLKMLLLEEETSRAANNQRPTS